MSKSPSTPTNMVDLTSAPQQLISTQGHEKGHGINLVKDTINALSRRTKPAVVVAIVGKSRTGKSYLLNKLAGKDVQDNEKRFKVGALIQAQTHGIWIWVVDHPTKPDHDLILLDTEGFGAPEKVNTDNDMWIYCLTTLLGSTLVLNIQNSIDATTIDDISFVTKMANVLKVDSRRKSGEDHEFDAYFPALVVAIRNFSLTNTEANDDQYLEKCLKLIKGDDEMTKKFNHSRECIRKYFHTRKCFTFDPPGGRKVCANMAKGDDSKVGADFCESVANFKNYVMKDCPVKVLRNGIPITGRMLSELLKSYVDNIQNNRPPCIEEAVEKMAAVENEILVDGATALFRKEMEALEPPAPSQGVFQNAKTKAELAALQMFLLKSIDDFSGDFHLKLKEQLENEASRQQQTHDSASKTKCEEVLKEMYQSVEDKMLSDAFKGPEGKRHFEESLNDIHSRFEKRSDLGTKKTEVLIKFLQERQKDFEEIQMMESFKALTTKVKSTEEEKEKMEKEQESEANKKLIDKHASVRRKMILKRQYSFVQLQESRNIELERLKEEGFADLANHQEQEMIRVKELHDNRLSVLNQKVDELKRNLDELTKTEVCLLPSDKESLSPPKGFLYKLWRRITKK